MDQLHGVIQGAVGITEEIVFILVLCQYRTFPEFNRCDLVM